MAPLHRRVVNIQHSVVYAPDETLPELVKMAFFANSGSVSSYPERIRRNQRLGGGEDSVAGARSGNRGEVGGSFLKTSHT